MPRGGARPGAGRPRKPRELQGVDRPARSAAAAPKGNQPRTLAGALKQAKDLTVRLMSELDAVTLHVDALEDLIIDETARDRDPRRRNAMLQAVSLSSRAATLKLLIAATRTWADLERAAARQPGDKPGKKEQRAAAAKQASVGKFAPPAPPRTIQ
jgi:hypothetical protein